MYPTYCKWLEYFCEQMVVHAAMLLCGLTLKRNMQCSIAPLGRLFKMKMQALPFSDQELKAVNMLIIVRIPSIIR